MRLALRLATLLASLGLATVAWAQVNPPVAPNVPPPLSQQPSLYGGNWELFLGGSYSTARATLANGNTVSTTNVPGAQLSLRYHVTDTNAVELRWNLSEPLQTYGPTLRVKSRANEFEFAYVWTYPSEGSIRPFLLGGASLIHYAPVGSASTPGAASQVRPAIVYGGGLDFKISSKWSARAEYRGLFYRVPDFGLIGISKWNHLPQPDFGIVYHF